MVSLPSRASRCRNGLTRRRVPVIHVVAQKPDIMRQMPHTEKDVMKSFILRCYFHRYISLLEPFVDPSWVPGRALSSAPVELDSVDGLAIQDILDCRKVGRRYEYFVHWKDQPISERSWILFSDISTSQDELLNRFHRRHPKVPKPPRFNISRHFPPPSPPPSNSSCR